MRKFCLIGEKLGHSMSPQIHRELFDLSKKQGDYSLLEIKKENFSFDVKKLKDYDGYNITIPYKIDIIPFLSNLEPSAKRYGAVNCVKNVGGKSIGYNTDVDGFLKSLDANNIALDQKVLLLETILKGGALTIALR